MNTSRHHADWLSLVEVSGPFLSLPVLLRVFPQGLEARDPAQAKALRAAYDEWQANPVAPGLRRAWILHVLTNLLGYPSDLLAEGQTLLAGMEANVAQMGETLRPDFALIGPKNSEIEGQVQLLISVYPAGQSLDRPLADRHWKASPATRMMELLHVSGVPLGLVTNGEHWMLVYAPRGETTGYASWYGALWLDEPITLRAFHSLLGVRRFFGVDAPNTLLGLLKESAQDQQEVTDQLGYQVREAVQVLVQAFDMLDQDTNRTLLKGLKETDLYDSALTVMMRLVFLFSAEERGLLHLGKPLYDDNYAVSTLMEQLQEVADLHGPQVLERRCDAWARLLAAFRAVHGGVHHQDLMMPAYGGSLFDPDRYPFLEGRAAGTKWVTTPAELLNINNRVVLHLLSSLQRLRMKVPGGGPSESRRISFRALGVEQIGHVYEGLLDHTAVRATEPVLGILGTHGNDAEIPLAKLESILTKGQEDLIEFLHDETGRTEKAIKRALDEGTLNEEHRLLIACGHDAGLLQRVRTFAGLIREDSFERPMVVLPGSVYVTAGTTRRSTGTHYTPPSLTEPIVQHTLEPLVYRGPAEGLPQGEWQLKSPKEILDLKVCDLAMGSGAFLVQACRYLSERLAESWENEEKKHPNEILITPEGGFSQGAPSERLIPTDATERLAIARRIVADRCLYGVDINPMAVEMAKLSMWLITLDAKRPFTFLDHAFKCGDSLLGLSSFKQLEDFSLRPEGVKQVAFSTMNLWRHVEEAKKKRQMLEAMPSDTPEQVLAKGALYADAEAAVVKLKAAADILVATELEGHSGKRYEEALEGAADLMMAYWARGIEELTQYATDRLGVHKTFHWPLAFPEIIQQGGFNAFVGNPPFITGKRISSFLGIQYQDYLKSSFTNSKGAADICCFFIRRAYAAADIESGQVGMIATKSIAEGDSRLVGLVPILESKGCIRWAHHEIKWPGEAGVTVSLLVISKGQWSGLPILNDREVARISSRITEEESLAFPLRENEGRCSDGIKIQGDGFIISHTERESLLSCDASASEVISPYITGMDMVQGVGCKPSAWIVNFRTWDLERASSYQGPFQLLVERVKPYRDSLTGQIHESDFWKFWDKREQFFDRMSSSSRILACPSTAKYLIVDFIQDHWIASHSVKLFAFDDDWSFSVMQSTIHELWAREQSGKLEMRLAYNLGKSFATFPRPEKRGEGAVGKAYHELRASISAERGLCFTDVYNLFHAPEETSADILKLRKLHSEIDELVADAYLWGNLALHHGFHITRQGIRYTICEAARRTVLDYLLGLNYKRHAEEKAEEMILGKQPKAAGKRGRKAKAKDADERVTLFSEVGE